MDIRLSHPEFHASVAAVRSAAERVGSAQARASGQMALLLEDGGWEGRAASSFASAWATWLSASSDLVASLSSTASLLAEVYASHTSVDAEVSSDLSRLTGRLR